ncbi:MAG: hypothetical protein AAGN35_17020 [Bacteroidota bacterium]
MIPRPSFAALIGCALLLCLAFTACDNAGTGSGDNQDGPTPEQILAKSWKLKRLNMGPDPAPPQVMVNSSFNFYRDGRYEILMGELERGTWSLDETKTILITMPENQPGLRNMIDIEKISEERVILYNKQAMPHPIRMVLEPVGKE